jgi:iron uptake system component EfeO
MSRRLRVVLRIAIALAAVVFVACGNDDETAAGGGTTIQVALQEWAVVPDTASAPAGEVTFEIENAGEETHEFVVIRTDLAVTDLPTAEDGSVDEEGAGIEVVDEVEDLAAGASETLTLDLEAGQYDLICNIVEEEGEMEMEMPQGPSHFQNGMRTEFTVE